METNPFDKSRPETSSADEDDTESSTYKKKKKTNQRPPLFEAKETKKSDEATGEKSVGDSLWRRLLGQAEGDETKPTVEKSEESTGEEAPEPVAELSEEEAARLPLEELSPEEQAAVVQEYLAARQAELIEEQARAIDGDDEQLAAERAADLALLDATRQLLREQPGEPYEHPLQQAYERVAEYFGARPTDETSAEQVADVPEPTGPETVPTPQETAQTWYVREQVANADAAPTVAVMPRAEASVGATIIETKQENHTGTALLVGAAVGYLVGRRRGRIKTEKQAAKVEKKLTAQIHNLERAVAEKERRIRTVAREAYAKARVTRGVTSEALHTGRVPAREASAVAPVPVESSSANPMRAEREPQRAFTPSSELLVGAVTLKAVEAQPARSGNEATAATAPTRERRAESASQKKVAKSAESMPRKELLEKAADISVGATNLRRVYETNLVSEQGLRRLMVAHERGEDVQRMLRQELVEKESSFERDPRMRNRSAVGALAAGAVVALPTTSAGTDKSTSNAKSDSSDDSAAQAQTTKDPDESSQVVGVATAATLVVIIAVLLYILFTSR